ncbi:ubiquinol-cytochrome c reductase iron-sulfur subunit [Aquisphaera insulae]|uniref:QcrA and Rieske domain-containing protein n=1 Tax=Aquisphaera insulae TaxID=2712864 RepID=UPI00196A9226|nr:ubiquinol-cytochrome c reductase iron-sulfur subunit [Aquisphaera insulae]
MAKRPSVQEILEAARRGGPAKPAAVPESAPAAAPIEEPTHSEAAEVAPAAPAAPARPAAPAGPTPSSLGRPLTLKEKLAAARAGGAAAAAPAPSPPPTPSAPPPAAEAAGSEATPARAVPPPAKPLGRPLTLAEKLAAARGGGGGAAPAPAAGPAKAAPAAKAAAATTAGAPRTLPPLDKITDPKDLAEALRQTGARKDREVAAEKAAAAPARPAAKAAPPKPSTVLPKPGKPGAATAEAPDHSSRRGFFLGPLFVTWIALAWTSFAAGVLAFTGMLGRFMFPNVLAEPPSTIKVGEPGKFDPEDVNERFKAEWGFWIVRSTRYDGQDIIYALSTICTHLGCPPNWLAGEQKFKCPCHGSGFYVTGINFEGPAPRPLERFKVSLADDGQIIVDKSQKFQQELGQWADPDSFIAV